VINNQAAVQWLLALLFLTIRTALTVRAASMGLTMTATNHDDQLGDIYPTMLNELSCTFGVSFFTSSLLWPSWSWFVAVGRRSLTVDFQRRNVWRRGAE